MYYLVVVEVGGDGWGGVFFKYKISLMCIFLMIFIYFSIIF